MDANDDSGYLERGPFSDPRGFRPMLTAIVDEIGPDPRALAARVRSLMVHVFWLKAYGLSEDRARAEEATNLRDLPSKLRLISEAEASLGRPAGSAGPLPPELRLFGNCRDFSLFFAALLREAGIPARARCGFGMYFAPDRGEDHWVVERRDRGSARWAISDPQLDEVMVERLKIPFDPMDLPDGAFLSGGEAWLACRGGDDPGRYGIFDMHGWDFVKGDFVRDVASLAGLELLPWDLWGAMMESFDPADGAALAALDAAARETGMRAPLTRAEAARLTADPRFAVPRRITSYVGGEAREVDLGPILGPDWAA